LVAVNDGRDQFMPYDVVVSGGLIVDGTGAPARQADIGINGAVIAEIAPAGTLCGRDVIAAAGLTVAPGFFDLHSHADFTVYADGRAQSVLLQGITSIMTGNCGIGVAPLVGRGLQSVPMSVPGWRGDRPGVTWRDFGEYLDVLRERRVGVNVFPLIAHGTLRMCTTGLQPVAASASDIADMRVLTEDAMSAGAAGFSTGLEYIPGIAADVTELTAISAAVGEYSGLYATHCRNRTSQIVEAADEAVRIAAEGGCRLQLSHFLPRPGFPDARPYKQAMERTRNGPVTVAFDVFPFDYGPTPLSTILPGWARQGGRGEIAERLRDWRLRESLIADLDHRFLESVRIGIADTMHVASDGQDGVLVGRTLGDLSAGRSVVDTALDLLAAAGQDFSDVTVIERWADQQMLVEALAAEDYLIMGDGITAALDGGTAGLGFALSDWGYAPTMLAKYVRDDAVTSLESAVHRMTQAPARQAGVHDRGAIAVGQAADVVMFDYTVLAGHASPAEPRKPPIGIRHVLVNGRSAVTNGSLTGELAGRVGLPR
jgi:N-acyl-D-amino-acid deacylase